jgi:hypothetical protein
MANRVVHCSAQRVTTGRKWMLMPQCAHARRVAHQGFPIPVENSSTHLLCETGCGGRDARGIRWPYGAGVTGVLLTAEFSAAYSA